MLTWLKATVIALAWTRRNKVPFNVNYDYARTWLKYHRGRPWYLTKLNVDDWLLVALFFAFWSVVITAIILVALVTMDAVLRLIS